MKINFYPIYNPDKQTESDLPYYFEGRFVISIRNKTFFDESNFLLIEFGLCAKKWLEEFNPARPSNLVYESMDYEEVPVLAFVFVENDGYKVISPLQKFQCDDLFDKDIVTNAIDAYLIKLETALTERYSTTLANIQSLV